MDSVAPKRRGKRLLFACAGGVLLALLVYGAWLWVPRGLQVSSAEARLATVEKGVFRDDIVVRATAEPLNSVILDSVESGRVEEIFARDGALVRKGQLLFRLSNPQRNLELLERQAEHAQQISNLSNLRVSQEAGRTEHQRRLSDLEFALQQGEKQHARNLRLAQQGFISNVALEESNDRWRSSAAPWPRNAPAPRPTSACGAMRSRRWRRPSAACNRACCWSTPRSMRWPCARRWTAC
jgi:HlyD family secretion protein